MAVMAQASSIGWGNSSAIRLVDKSGANISQSIATSASLAVYLVNASYLDTLLLDSGDLINMLKGTYAGGGSKNVGDYAFHVLSGSSAISDMTPGMLSGANKSYTYGTTGQSTAQNGDDFFVLITATFGSETYYALYDNNWEITATNGSQNDTFTWSGLTPAASDWVKYEVIPEPLTVGLALAGVALLIAQRKRK